METQKIGVMAGLAASEKKAQGIILQDLTGLSDVCSYQLICSGMNERQTQAICENIDAKLKGQIGLRPLAIEGKGSGHWVLMDYGDLIVHIFVQQMRIHYGLEQLWPSAKQVELPLGKS